MSEHITREEFGFDLFEAIVCCGSIIQLKQLREHTPPNKIKPAQLTDWQLKEKDLTARLMELTKSLQDADVAELIRRYPFMAAL